MADMVKRDFVSEDGPDEIDGRPVVDRFAVLWRCFESDEQGYTAGNQGYVTDDGRVWLTSRDTLYTATLRQLEERQQLAAQSAEGLGRAMRALKKKPLRRKAYGSIPHLPHSRLGPGEHHVTPGQSDICTVKKRGRHDRVIITEKLDGANVAVARVKGALVALSRVGFRVETSPFSLHHVFGEYVQRVLRPCFTDLEEGQSVHGEWLYQAHGTRYVDLPGLFFVFDIMHGGRRIPWDQTVAYCQTHGLLTVPVLSDGPAVPVADLLPRVTSWLASGEIGEGLVYRVETHGTYNFLAKYLRPEKRDGIYLPEVSGDAAVLNTLSPALN